MITGFREKQLIDAANLLLDTRRNYSTITDLPTELQPTSIEEVYAIQDEMARAYETIGGWKIGAPTSDAEPTFCPMPLAWMAGSGAILAGPRYRYRGIEAEIAFLLGEDLPPRDNAYTRDEVLGAIASCHPAVEELESAFSDPASLPRLTSFCDLHLHGAFIHGPALGDWRSIDFANERVTLSVDGTVRVERTGSNTSGDLLRLLPFLANEGAARTGGLRAGQWITTGSWTGNLPVPVSSEVSVAFDRAGRVDLRFV